MMRSRTPQIAAMALAIVVVLLLDQITKAWIVGSMAVRQTQPIIEGWVRLRYTQNTGSAFGLFQGWTGPLSIVAVVIIAGIVMSAQRVSNGNRVMLIALGLVLGGALGNLMDRLRLGYVVDFVEVYGPHIQINNKVYTWPIFNVADSAITVGVVLILATLLFGSQPSKKGATAMPRTEQGTEQAEGHAGDVTTAP